MLTSAGQQLHDEFIPNILPNILVALVLRPLPGSGGSDSLDCQGCFGLKFVKAVSMDQTRLGVEGTFRVATLHS